MTEISADCPRCGYDKVTFDVVGVVQTDTAWDWQKTFEVFSVCRHCHRGTILVARDIDPNTAETTRAIDFSDFRGSLNNLLYVYAIISIKDRATETPPEHLPAKIEQYFKEGAQCVAIGCYNAGGTMFRLCLDAASKDIIQTIPKEVDIPKKTQYSLGFRLEWLFEKGYLDKGLEELAECVKEDGNDGAHDGSLTEHDAADLHDFTIALLNRLYSEPARLSAAKVRRMARRKGTSD
ncbi:DUF4145 domain-containing protein [Burkholderia gladioli]|uniref:DUF4145 domain-containing protein n=1 Tax=Burkholderia gladioli TaxID=28095 RepID=UPI001640A4E7|nr:DUF4145 domain-containing protein [Burkholderia gladioli]